MEKLFKRDSVDLDAENFDNNEAAAELGRTGPNAT